MMFTRIRTRIVFYLVATAVFSSVLFALLGLLFSYHIEDSMFNQLLSEERQRIERQINRGEAPKPTMSYMQFYLDRDQLPEEVLNVLIEEPNRVEFSGAEGKHYHLMRLEQGYLLAEVSDYLIVRKVKGDMATMQLTIMVVIALLVALVAWFIARRLIRPIDQLNSILSDVQGRQLPVGFSSGFGGDEIGMFAKELDRALSRVQAFIKREQDFTRDVSHELRTPITISQGAISLMKASRMDGEQSELVDRLQQAQDQMQQCIEGLLALAREEGFKREPVRVLPLIESAIVEHHQLLESGGSGKGGKKDIALHLEVAPDAVYRGDAQAIRIILSNLIVNAFTHTESGDIYITGTPSTLTVTNTCSPIDSQLLPDIFQSGVKGEKSSGYGIGLSLVRRLCERLDIAIIMESREHQTEVTLRWPD